MGRQTLALFIAFAALASGGCRPSAERAPEALALSEASGAETAEACGSDVSPAALREALGGGLRPALVDVRTGPEVRGGRLDGARHVSFFGPGFPDRAQAAGVRRDEPVYLYCATGVRSAEAARRLCEAGFREVYNAGGYAALARAGLPTSP